MVVVILSRHWMPLGYTKGVVINTLFITLMLGSVLFLLYLFQKYYQKILGWCLDHKLLFLSMPATLVIIAGFIWASLGKEFMPSLDEGSFLYMPTTMPHASIGEALDVLQKQDMAFQSIPEVESVVGKIGRVESALDPAPVSMIETVINYNVHSE